MFREIFFAEQLRQRLDAFLGAAAQIGSMFEHPAILRGEVGAGNDCQGDARS